MAALGIAGMIVQLLTVLALCIHHRRTVRILESVMREQKTEMTALSAMKTMQKDIGELNKCLEEAAAPRFDAEMMTGFEALMGYSERTARGVRE